MLHLLFGFTLKLLMINMDVVMSLLNPIIVRVFAWNKSRHNNHNKLSSSCLSAPFHDFRVCDIKELACTHNNMDMKHDKYLHLLRT